VAVAVEDLLVHQAILGVVEVVAEAVLQLMELGEREWLPTTFACVP